MIPTTLKMMVYGQAGMGKTTIALSTPKPLLLDFDGGAKRINEQHLDGVDIVQVQNWDEMYELMKLDLSAYQTIVVDTVGKMMDYIIMKKCGMRQPKIQDWGGINAEFSWFTRSISSLGKNIVFVAHRDTRKEGDDTVYIPALREKSYSSIVSDLDLLGYLEARQVNGVMKRIITFDPTNRNDGKNTCLLPSSIEIPTIIDQRTGKCTAKNDFLEAMVIAPYLKMLLVKKTESDAYNAVINELNDAIDIISDEQSANEFVANINNFNHAGSSKQYASVKLSEKAKSLGLVFDKETKKYAQG